eukprot:1050771-Pelagomonas_calceolata.AAC.3
MRRAVDLLRDARLSMLRRPGYSNRQSTLHKNCAGSRAAEEKMSTAEQKRPRVLQQAIYTLNCAGWNES